jgi:hypothetical protein
MVEKTFRQQLTAWRKFKGFRSMAAAARDEGIPYRTFQDWSSGERTPRGFALRIWEKRFTEMEKENKQEQTKGTNTNEQADC